MGTFGGNGEECIRGTHRLHQKNHGEASAADRRRDVGDARGRSSVGRGRNAVGDDLYRETAGNRGTVGGVMTNIRSVYRVEGIRGGWMQERGLVETRVERETTSVQLVRSIAGS